MISKTFKSAKSPLELGVVRANPDHVRVWIGEADKRMFGMIDLAPSDAPALALAILEAAGAHKDSQDFLGGAVEQLKFHIGEQERITAEAKAQAELEAEALELRNEYFDKECAWSDINDDGQALWLRMARKSREMREEK